MRGFLTIALAVAVLVSPSLAQQPPAVKESVEVHLVEIPVNVYDRSGKPVRGLKSSNFEILDEGRKRPVAFLEEIDLNRMSAALEAPLHPAARRNFLLLFDFSNSSPGNVIRARDAARDFILKQIQDRDLAAVATFSVENGFRLLTSFTTDRALLAAAVDTLGNPKFWKSSDPLLLSATFNIQAPTRPETPEAGSRLDREIEYLEQLRDVSRLQDQANDEQKKTRIRRQLRNFGGIARALDRIQGRKQVILMSEGFDARLVHGRESMSSQEAQQETDATLNGEVWRIDTDRRYGSAATSNEVTEMSDLFRRSDVVLHAIDIKGLRTDVDPREGSKKSSNESLFLLTNPTGGQVFKNANDLNANFEKLLTQQEVVYVIGFNSPSTTTPGKFHNVKIKLVDVPGGRARHRAGYYEPSAVANPIENTLSATDILLSDVPLDDVKTRVLATTFPSPEANARVPVVVEIGGPSLREGVPGDKLNGEIFIYAFDKEHAVKDYLHQRFALDLTKVAAPLAASGLKYYGSLALPPGEYAIKTLVRVDESGRSGFQRTNLNVPRFTEPVVLQPFVYEEEGKWLMLRGRPRSVAEVDYPFEVAKESFIPSAYAHFGESEKKKLALFTYNIPDTAVEMKIKVRNSAGAEQPAKVVLLSRTPMDEHKAIKYVLSLDAAGFAAGTYSLEIEVRNKEDGSTRTSVVPFTVEGKG